MSPKSGLCMVVGALDLPCVYRYIYTSIDTHTCACISVAVENKERWMTERHFHRESIGDQHHLEIEMLDQPSLVPTQTTLAGCDHGPDRRSKKVLGVLCADFSEA